MLVPNLRPKVVPHDGSRLLLGLNCTCSWTTGGASAIPRRCPTSPAVRPCCANRKSLPWPSSPNGPASAARGTSGASLLRTCALTSPSCAPKANSTGASEPCSPSCVRVAAGLRLGSCPAFGRLPCDGHHPGAGDGEGEGFSQGAVLRAGFLREERLQDRVDLRVLKAALVVDPNGVVTAFGLAPAASDERPIGEALVAEDHYDAYLADKGFTGLEWERRWMEIYGALVAATPKNDSRRAWPKADRRWASSKRQIIEGVIGQLKDFFALERHRAKTLGGLLTPLAAKIAAYTCAQRMNDFLGRPLRHLADLLV